MAKLGFTLFCVVVLVGIQQLIAFRQQSVAVKGHLFCGNQPAGDTLVQLWDVDTGPDPDDLLDKNYTDSQGRFLLSGDITEWTNIDPEVRIYHDCAMHLPVTLLSFPFPLSVPIHFMFVFQLCKREWVVGIPDEYIWSGRKPKSTMDIGRVNLEVELESEDRHDCIH